MRTSIKLITLGITIAIFILLNLLWWIIVPEGQKIETTTLVLIEGKLIEIPNLAYYLPFVILIAGMVIIAIYFYTKSKQKTRIKL